MILKTILKTFPNTMPSSRNTHSSTAHAAHAASIARAASVARVRFSEKQAAEADSESAGSCSTLEKEIFVPNEEETARRTNDFYLAGRSLPWYVAGTSIVATSFAADTPLVVTGWVRSAGISQNWLWWGMAGGGAAAHHT